MTRFSAAKIIPHSGRTRWRVGRGRLTMFAAGVSLPCSHEGGVEIAVDSVWRYESGIVRAIYFRFRGRWITPYEQRVRGLYWPSSYDMAFAEAYGGLLAEQRGRELRARLRGGNPYGNALLSILPKEDSWKGARIVAPRFDLLGVPRG